jgi:hypothetical protein
MAARIGAVHSAVGLLDDDALRGPWRDALRATGARGGVHGLVAGRCWRLLLDGGDAGSEQVGATMARALSAGADPAAGAAWLEGFLAGSGLVLVHDRTLLGLVDDWLAGIAPEHFAAALPLVRRSFAELTAPERRQVADRIRAGAGGGPAGAAEPGAGDGLDADRVAAALPLVARLLGVAGG